LDVLHVCFLVSQEPVLLQDQHASSIQKSEAERKDAMEDTPIDLPLGYAEFRIRGVEGADALSAKAYTYADLAKIVGFMPIGLEFEVYLYCNRIQVGNALYRRHNPHVEPVQEHGACVQLFQGEFPVPPAIDPPLPESKR
jgi:hypothetical protein